MRLWPGPDERDHAVHHRQPHPRRDLSLHLRPLWAGVQKTWAMSSHRLCWEILLTVFRWFLEDHYFGGMDWGNANDNIAHHGTEEPPVYNLKNINTKVEDPWFSFQLLIFWHIFSLHFSMETMTGWQQSRTWVGFISSSQIVLRTTRWNCRQILKRDK